MCAKRRRVLSGFSGYVLRTLPSLYLSYHFCSLECLRLWAGGED